MIALGSFTPLLEREAERARLGDAWRRASAGRGSAWFVCAEAGGGKTRLLQEIASGGAALWAAAEPVVPPEPFQPIVQALPGFVPAETRAESVSRAVTAFERAAGAKPMIVVFDDLHFADEGTVAVFVRLSALCEDRPWLALAGVRPGEGSPPLALALAELVAQGRARRLDLAPLSRVAVGALVAHVRGGAAEGAEIEALHRDSGGNPWFALALAGGVGAMSAARDRILLRLERLEQTLPGACVLLASIAPAGEPLPHAVLSRRFGGDTPDLRRMLRGLREYGVLQETAGGAWQFRHELLRRGILDEMLEVDRRDAHRALAEALEDAGGRAASIAMHYAAAGDTRAGPWALQAAEEAQRVDAHAEAMAQVERALAVPLDPATRLAALRLAALEAHTLGRFEESRARAEDAISLPGTAPEERAYLHWIAARAALTLRDLLSNEMHLSAAERELEGRPPGYLPARISLARASRSMFTLEPARAREAALRALNLAAACDPAQAQMVEFEANRPLVEIALNRGDTAGCVALDRLLTYADQHRLRAGFAAAALTGTYVATVLALFAEQSRLAYGRLIEHLRTHEFAAWEDLAAPFRVLELVQCGQYDDARTQLRSMADSGADGHSGGASRAVQAMLELRAGSPDTARRLLENAPPPVTARDATTLNLARLEAATLGAVPALATIAETVYACASDAQLARLAGVAAVALARAGRPPPPVPGWIVAEAPLCVFWVWAAGLARRDSARLCDVSARLATMTCPYEAALARADAGDLARAYRALRDLGATTAREQVAARLRAAGRPVPRRTRDAIERDGLTETEIELCRLVTAGESNEAIAARLSMSVRTVEAHLTGVYQKTGRRRRAALASWWVQKQ